MAMAEQRTNQRGAPPATRRGRTAGAWLAVGAAAVVALAGCSSSDGDGSGSGSTLGGGFAEGAGLGLGGPAAQPVVLADVLGAYVPESCGHGPGTLVDGELPGIPTNQGEVMIATSRLQSEGEYLVAFGDFTGDGVDDAAVAIMCHAGGVGWPPLIQLYTDGGEWLGGVDLADLPGEGGRGAPETLDISDGNVLATWKGYYDGEGGANTLRPLSGVFSWDGSQVVVEDVQG